MISGGGNFKLIALVMLMAAVAGCYGPAWPGPPGRAAPPQSQASVSAPSEWYGAADSRALVRHYPKPSIGPSGPRALAPRWSRRRNAAARRHAGTGLRDGRVQ